MWLKNLNLFIEGLENIVGKRKKCWLPAFSPFPTMFSKGFFKVVESRDCVVKRYNLYAFYVHCNLSGSPQSAEPHSPVGIVADLRTGGRWFDPNILSEYWWWSLRQDSFPSHRGPLFLQWLCGKAGSSLEWESRQWLGKNIVLSAG